MNVCTMAFQGRRRVLFWCFRRPCGVSVNGGLLRTFTSPAQRRRSDAVAAGRGCVAVTCGLTPTSASPSPSPEARPLPEGEVTAKLLYYVPASHKVTPLLYAKMSPYAHPIDHHLFAGERPRHSQPSNPSTPNQRPVGSAAIATKATTSIRFLLTTKLCSGPSISGTPSHGGMAM